MINFWSSLSTKSKQQSRLTKMTIQHYQNQKKISVNVKRKIITSSVNVKRDPYHCEYESFEMLTTYFQEKIEFKFARIF